MQAVGGWLSVPGPVGRGHSGGALLSALGFPHTSELHPQDAEQLRLLPPGSSLDVEMVLVLFFNAEIHAPTCKPETDARPHELGLERWRSEPSASRGLHVDLCDPAKTPKPKGRRSRWEPPRSYDPRSTGLPRGPHTGVVTCVLCPG